MNEAVETIKLPDTSISVKVTDLNYEIFTSFDKLEGLRGEWDDFVSAVGSDIYFSFDWCRVWWSYYGSNRNLQIYLFRNGKDVVGIVPMFYERIWLGPVWMRIGKLLCSDFTTALCNPPVQGEISKDIYEIIIKHLIIECRCDAVWFGPLGGNYGTMESLQATRKSLENLTVVTRKTIFAPHTLFSLPDTFDLYLQSLDKQERGNFRRSMKHLVESYSVDVKIIRDEDQAVKEFVNFKEMHDLQWQSEGRLGHFGDWPKSTAYTLDLIRSQARLGRLRLVRISANGEILCYQLCFTFGGCYFWRLPARVTGREWDRYGLGRIGLVKMIEVAIEEGIDRIEAGAGHYNYKVRLGGTEFQLQSVMISAKNFSSLLRSRLFCFFADALHTLYYKIWFGRVAPKLWLKRRPLRKIWIRSHL